MATLQLVASPAVYAQEALKRDIERLREKERKITAQQKEYLDKNMRPKNGENKDGKAGKYSKGRSSNNNFSKSNCVMSPSTNYIHFQPRRVIKYEDLYEDPDTIFQNVTSSRANIGKSLRFGGSEGLGLSLGYDGREGGGRVTGSRYARESNNGDYIRDDMDSFDKDMKTDRDMRYMKESENPESPGYPYFDQDENVNGMPQNRGVQEGKEQFQQDQYNRNDECDNGYKNRSAASDERDKILASIMEGKMKYIPSDKKSARQSRREYGDEGEGNESSDQEDINEWCRKHLSSSKSQQDNGLSKVVADLEKRVATLETGMRNIENTMSYLTESQLATGTLPKRGSGISPILKKSYNEPKNQYSSENRGNNRNIEYDDDEKDNNDIQESSSHNASTSESKNSSVSRNNSMTAEDLNKSNNKKQSSLSQIYSREEKEEEEGEEEKKEKEEEHYSEKKENDFDLEKELSHNTKDEKTAEDSSSNIEKEPRKLRFEDFAQTDGCGFEGDDEKGDPNMSDKRESMTYTNVPESTFVGDDTYVSTTLNTMMSSRSHSLQYSTLSRKLKPLRAKDGTQIFRIVKVSIAAGQCSVTHKTLWVSKHHVVTGDTTDTGTATGAFSISHVKDVLTGQDALDRMIEEIIKDKRQNGMECSEEDARQFFNEEAFPCFMVIQTERHVLGYSFTPEDYPQFLSIMREEMSYDL